MHRNHSRLWSEVATFEGQTVRISISLQESQEVGRSKNIKGEEIDSSSEQGVKLEPLPSLSD